MQVENRELFQIRTDKRRGDIATSMVAAAVGHGAACPALISCLLVFGMIAEESGKA